MSQFLLLSGGVGASAIVDLVALGLIVLFCVWGLIRGFVKVFISIFGRILSLLLAVLLCSSMAVFLSETFGLTNTIASWLMGVVSNIFGDELANTTLLEATESSLNNFSISSWLVKIILEAKNSGDIAQTTTLNQIISPALAHYIVLVISAVILYIIFRIIFFIVGEIVSKLHKIKLIGSVDKSLGAVLGLIWGIISVQVIVFVINVIPLGFFQEISVAIDQSAVTSFISSINLFGFIISSITSKDILATISNFVKN